MIWYLLLAACPFVVAPIVNTYYKSSIIKNDKAKKTFLFWCGLALFLMISLRHYSVGSTDSMNYYNNWLEMQRISFGQLKNQLINSEMEPGYLTVVWALSKVFRDAQFLFVFTGGFFSFSVCRFIYKNSEDPTLSFVMYITLSLFTFMIQALRQAIAMCICLFAIEFCKKRKIIPFILLVLLAMSFHTSAIAFIPVYFLGLIPLKMSTYAAAFAVSGALLAFSGPLINYANEWYGSEYYRVVDSGGFIALAVYILILLVAFLYQDKCRDKKLFDFFFLLTFFGATVYSMRYIGGLIAGRMSNYYMFGQVILLPNIIGRMERQTKIIVYMITLALCILLFAYRLSTSDLIPFMFYWQ